MSKAEISRREGFPGEVMHCLRTTLDTYHKLFDALENADDAGDHAEISGRLENLSIRTNGYAHGCMSFLKATTGDARAAAALGLFDSFDGQCAKDVDDVGLAVSVYAALYTLIISLEGLDAYVLPEQEAQH